MPSASWLNGWLTGDVVTTAEFSKSSGAFFDSTLGSAGASFDITSVPTWGSHIKIVLVGRGDTAASSVAVTLRFNNDAAANYTSERLFANATSVTGSESVSATSANAGGLAAASATANHAGMVEIVIPNFRGTTFFKNYTGVSGWTQALTTTNVNVDIRSGAWASTSAITRVTIIPGAGNFVAGSRCTAYVLGP